MVGIAAKSWSEQSTVIFESRQIHWHFLGQLEMLVTLVTTSKAKKMASKAKKSSFLLSPGSSFCWTPAIIIKMATESHQAMVQASRVQSRRKWKQSSSLGSHHHLPEKDKSFLQFSISRRRANCFLYSQDHKKTSTNEGFLFFRKPLWNCRR